MTQAYGHQAFLAYKPETTYGTHETTVPAGNFLEIMEESVVQEQTMLEKTALRSSSLLHRVKSKKTVNGSFKLAMPWINAGHFLYQALGAVSVGAGPPYSHTITPAINLPSSMTLWIDRDSAALGGGSTSWRYGGCQVSKLTLRQEATEFLEMEVEVMGKSETLVARETPTFIALDGIDWLSFTSMKHTSGSVTMKVKSLEIVIDNNLVDDHYNLGSDSRTKLAGRAGPRRVTFSAEVEFDSSVDYALYASLAATDFEFLWDGDANQQLKISMPNVFLEGDPPTISDSGPVNFTMNGVAFQNTAELDEVVVVLKNATSDITV